MSLPAMTGAAPARPVLGPRDFDAWCQSTLVPRLHGLEVRRRKIVTLVVSAVACVAGSIPIFAIAANGSALPIEWLLPPLLIAAVVFGIVAYMKHRAYRADFKQEIMPEVVRFVSPDLRYDPADYVNMGFFEAGQLFKHSIDSYDGEDLVQGKLGKTAFEFSELHVQYKTESTDSKGRTTTHWHTIFKGVYFVADFNKHFRTRTVVLPDTMERAFGFIGKALQKINPGRDKLIALEDPEFEKEFVVYGEDQVEARYILSPALMRRMLELKHKVNVPVHFAFVGSSVHVAIAIGKNHFEPQLFSSVLNLEHVREYHEDICAILGIIEDLNLNTRIWTKE
jgi:hypothetical protein